MPITKFLQLTLRVVEVSYYLRAQLLKRMLMLTLLQAGLLDRRGGHHRAASAAKCPGPPLLLGPQPLHLYRGRRRPVHTLLDTLATPLLQEPPPLADGLPALRLLVRRVWRYRQLSEL